MTEQLTTFLKKSQELTEEMNKLDTQIADEKQLWDMSVLEQSRILIQQLYLQVCNIGKNLREDMSNHHSDMLYENEFTCTIETHLETFTRRQTVIIEKWSKIETICREQKKGEENWGKCKQDADKILSLAKSLDEGMYPVLGADAVPLEGRQDQLTRAKLMLARIDHLITEV